MPRIYVVDSTVPQGNYIVLYGTRTDVRQEYHVISSTCSLQERNEHPKDLHNNANVNTNVDATVIISSWINKRVEQDPSPTSLIYVSLRESAEYYSCILSICPFAIPHRKGVNIM
jgi:hypothetical protein